MFGLGREKLMQQLSDSKTELAMAMQKNQELLESNHDREMIIVKSAQIIEEQNQLIAMLSAKAVRDQHRADHLLNTVCNMASDLETKNIQIGALQSGQTA